MTAIFETFWLEHDAVEARLEHGPMANGLCKVMVAVEGRWTPTARHIDRLRPVNEEARRVKESWRTPPTEGNRP